MVGFERMEMGGYHTVEVMAVMGQPGVLPLLHSDSKLMPQEYGGSSAASRW